MEINFFTSFDFNPPAPCGAGLPTFWRGNLIPPISIHPPLAGRDVLDVRKPHQAADFNPPAPCGAGRGWSDYTHQTRQISIHPPLAGRDIRVCFTLKLIHISIHPPLAGRDSDLAQKNCAKHRILHKKCIYPGRIERFSGFDAAIFLPNVHKFRCEPSEESLLAPRSHAYTIRTPSC